MVVVASVLGIRCAVGDAVCVSLCWAAVDCIQLIVGECGVLVFGLVVGFEWYEVRHVRVDGSGCVVCGGGEWWGRVVGGGVFGSGDGGDAVGVVCAGVVGMVR